MKAFKTELICYILHKAGGSLTRLDVLEQVYAMQPGNVEFKPTSNGCYFSPTGAGNGGEMSLIKKGLIEVDGRVGNYFTYVLTPAGEKVAQDFIARVTPEGATQR